MSTIYNSQLDAFELHHLIQEESDTPSSRSPSGSSPALEALGHALSGATGAALSNILIYPLDLIITRLQIQRQQQRRNSDENDGKENYEGLGDAVSKIVDKDGYSGLWAGCKGDTIKTVLDVGGFFLVYTFVRGRVLARKANTKHLGAIEELAVGWVSGALVRAVVMPCSVVVAKAQTRGMSSSSSQNSEKQPSSNNSDGGLQQIAHQIYREKGLQGFWAGYQAALVLTLNPSLTFALHAILTRSLPRSLRDRPGAVTTFLLSATSKAIASAIMYPFSLAKTRLMVGSSQEARDEEDIEREVDAHAQKHSNPKQRKVEKQLVKDTLLSTLYAITSHEGLSGLYAGLHLEMLKGFLSHGITMVVKQSLHRFIIKLYYLLSVLSRRYKPRTISSKRMRDKARENVEYYNLAMARAGEKIETDVRRGKEWVRGKANETAEFVGEYVDEEGAGVGEGWKEFYGPLGIEKWLGKGERDLK